ncbi:hypothetical protein OG321_42155 [Streptomyces sp. NBC_00424]|uniref:hypothetical protein n=1 Tax=Streptomyces sp. NBC_00424 TaxID=2903648 RepID=UPI0022581D1A|nr:hypothetical protein [Streptomyces sp. NBC_00424]MCX5079003.1 hypothetical protein [Streptomyces sp. NBC_00424]
MTDIVTLSGRPESAVHRTVWVELEGILKQVPATYHPSGPLVGRMVTGRHFRAVDVRGEECPVPVAMFLHRPTTRTDPRLIVVDDQGSRWVMAFTTSFQQGWHRITGFYPV